MQANNHEITREPIVGPTIKDIVATFAFLVPLIGDALSLVGVQSVAFVGLGLSFLGFIIAHAVSAYDNNARRNELINVRNEFDGLNNNAANGSVQLAPTSLLLY